MLRRLGTSDIEISAVGLGCWPMSGMTSIDVNDEDSRHTLRACRNVGINLLDTAFSYGAHGESDRLVAELLSENRREDYVIATKAGIHWNKGGTREYDARPATLRSHLELSLQRLGIDYVDLFYLHAPDPQVPIAESAGACRELEREGLTRTVGASNLSLQQLEQFHAACPIVACQPPYNMLQRQIEADILPWCREHNVSVLSYWPLMKGLLAGKLPRDHVFAPHDKRQTYPIFQGQQWQRNQDFVDELRTLSREIEKPVAEIVVNWTIHRPGITAALCGAKRPYQIRETARAMQWRLSSAQLARIAAALARRESA